jgi:putative solute:sodium symporter small subunit
MFNRRVQIEHRYWNRIRWFTLVLLLLWATFTFGLLWFARDLNHEWLGWPVGFWLAAQGGMLIYLLIVVVYAWVMHQMDRTVSQQLQATSMNPMGAQSKVSGPEMGN